MRLLESGRNGGETLAIESPGKRGWMEQGLPDRLLPGAKDAMVAVAFCVPKLPGLAVEGLSQKEFSRAFLQHALPDWALHHPRGLQMGFWGAGEAEWQEKWTHLGGSGFHCRPTMQAA